MKNTKEIATIIEARARNHEKICQIYRGLLSMLEITQKNIYESDFHDENLHSKVLDLASFVCKKYKFNISEEISGVSEVPKFFNSMD